MNRFYRRHASNSQRLSFARPRLHGISVPESTAVRVLLKVRQRLESQARSRCVRVRVLKYRPPPIPHPADGFTSKIYYNIIKYFGGFRETYGLNKRAILFLIFDIYIIYRGVCRYCII